MPRLTLAEVTSRRGLDYRVVRSTNGNGVLGVSAHRTLNDLRQGRVIEEAAGVRGEAQFYLAAYYFPVLIGAGKTTERVLVSFDISSGNYPYAEPLAAVLSRPLPWNPHVHPSSGIVCIGETWRMGRGKMLAAQLILHVAKLLNCDEPDRGSGYVGWNGAAINYWRTVMRKAPVTPGLAYPVPPVDITHGIPSVVDDSFAPVTSATAPADNVFSPVLLEVAS